MISPDPVIDAALEARGVVNVKLLLLQAGAAGPGLGSVVRGLSDGKGTEVSRGYVEDWLRRKDAEEREVDARNRRWTVIAALAAILAVLVSGAAWLFPVK